MDTRTDSSPAADSDGLVCFVVHQAQVSVSVRSHPLDVAAVSSGASQAQPDHVHQQTGDPQQVHGVPDERRGDDIVDKECSVIRQEDAPEGNTATPLKRNVLRITDHLRIIYKKDNNSCTETELFQNKSNKGKGYTYLNPHKLSTLFKMYVYLNFI